MAETYDPSKLNIATRLFKDEDEAGVIIDDNTREWKSGEVEITVYDKHGIAVTGKRIKVTRLKYLTFREDFDSLTTKEVISEYFPDVKLTDGTKTDLQIAADKAVKESEARSKEVARTEAEQEKVRFLSAEQSESADAPSDFQNVLPVGSPETDPSNPEQKIFAPEAKKIEDAGKEVVNPEQSAPNVPEDEFTKTGGNDLKTTVTNDVERDVVPAGADAKTNEEVRKTGDSVAKTSKK